MGKAQKPKLRKNPSKPYAKPTAKAKAQPTSITTASNGKQAHPQRPQHIPFLSHERTLLVGEGDFSFSASLSSHHNCTSLTCTSLDSRSTVLSKYPQAAAHLASLEKQTVLFSIDATKLGQPGTPGASILRRKPGFDCIVFNFPHVGGKSTDVNRQVRANQALVVAFLEGCLRVLAPGGKVVVTIFEGEPYELWGLRNLARHVGLAVERSFRFDAALYPGYRHARTLGNVEGGGGWKGEEREARMYVLKKKEDVLVARPRKRKKKGGEESSSSDEDVDEVEQDDGDEEDG